MDADHSHQLGVYDDLLTLQISLVLPRVLEVPETDRLSLASSCAQVTGTYADGFMFPSGGKPLRFRLYPPDVLWEEGKPLRRWVKGVDEHGKPTLATAEAPDALPLIYGHFPFSQVMAIGFLCAWLSSPETAAPGTYGPARLFPGTASAFYTWYKRQEVKTNG